MRIQLENPTYLTLAEVQVFNARANPINGWRGGKRVLGGTYTPEESLNVAFYGVNPGAGTTPWILKVEDMHPRETVNGAVSPRSEPARASGRGTSLRKRDIHGRGAVDEWTLTLLADDGRYAVCYMDIRSTVETLPQFGTLYRYNLTSGVREERPIDADPTQLRDAFPCYGDCEWKYRHGDSKSTSPDGSVAMNNRPMAENRPAVGFTNTPQVDELEDLGDPERVDGVFDQSGFYMAQFYVLPPHTTTNTWAHRWQRDHRSNGEFSLTYLPSHDWRHDGFGTGAALWPDRTDRTVVYVPNPGWTGTDYFTYSTHFGSEKSAMKGTVTLHVHMCRGGRDDCRVDPWGYQLPNHMARNPWAQQDWAESRLLNVPSWGVIWAGYEETVSAWNYGK